MNKQKFKSGTAFTDMLFLMLSGVTVLWVLSFLLINPVAKQHEVESPAEVIISMDWHDDSQDDLDMWLRTPSGQIIYYGNKDVGGATLERDDLGRSSDCIYLPSGEMECLHINREVIAIRNLEEGEYQLRFNVYQIKNVYQTKAGSRVDGNPVEVEITRINPNYDVLFSEEFEYRHPKQRVSITRFVVDKDGEITFNDLPADFEVRPSSRGGGDR